MLWQLGCTGLYLLLCVPIVLGLFAVRSLERRACLEPRSFVLARAFHRPLYTTCLLLVALRVAFFLLTAIIKLEAMDISVKVATFWLLDMSTVAMTALHGYILLFAIRLVFRRRWPDTTSFAPNTVLNAVFVAFCTSLVVLVTLVAVYRAQGGKYELVVPQWMTLGYSAVIWTTLGLLMVKYEGQAVRMLWKYRRRNQWSVTDDEKRSCQRLPVLSMSCLKNLGVCSTLLAELLVIRGIVCAVAACQSSENAVDADIDLWQTMMLHYVGWEVASVAIVLRMLHRTPIAVHCFSEKSLQPSSNTPSAPAIDDVDIQVVFQVPSVRELVADYVVPSNMSLLSIHQRGIKHDSTIEQRYCSMHHNGSSSGTEYHNCRCFRERDDQFLSNANVPLLTEEYEANSLAYESDNAILTNNVRSTRS